jgi:hypothetical protein
MSDLTADRIRAAAGYLHGRARNATPGPWYATSESDRYGGIVGPARDTTTVSEATGYGGELIAETVRGGNGHYLQVVAPAFGKTVASWLHVVADAWDSAAGLDIDEAAAVTEVVEAIEAAQREPLVRSVIVA